MSACVRMFVYMNEWLEHKLGLESNLRVHLTWV